jgi:16S rRNA processing protein RimM
MEKDDPIVSGHIHSERIAIGRVRKPFGLKGQFYADAFGRALRVLSPPKKLLCGKDEKEAKEVILIEIKETPRGFIGKFEGSESVEDAKRVRGDYLFLEKNDLPCLGSNEYYHFELEGMTVIAEPSGRPVGVVTRMQSFPTTDAFVVQKDDGSTVLIAMKGGIIQKIDREKGCILVNGSALEELL